MCIFRDIKKKTEMWSVKEMEWTKTRGDIIKRNMNFISINRSEFPLKCIHHKLFSLVRWAELCNLVYNTTEHQQRETTCAPVPSIPRGIIIIISFRFVPSLETMPWVFVTAFIASIDCRIELLVRYSWNRDGSRLWKRGKQPNGAQSHEIIANVMRWKLCKSEIYPIAHKSGSWTDRK